MSIYRRGDDSRLLLMGELGWGTRQLKMFPSITLHKTTRLENGDDHVVTQEKPVRLSYRLTKNTSGTKFFKIL